MARRRRMKRRIVLVLAVISFAVQTRIWGQEADYSLGSDRWIRFYSGYDFSAMDQLVNGVQAYEPSAKSLGYTNLGYDTGHGGLLLGLELGQQLDRDNALSISPELVISQGDTFVETNNGNNSTAAFQPSLIGATVNYTHTLFRAKGTRTFAVAGAGYYHAMLNVAETVVGANPGSFEGIFTGDTFGGILGLGQEFAIGSWISLELTVRGRWASFNELTTGKLNINGTQFVLGNGPYALYTGSANQNTVFLGPTSLAGAPGTQFMNLDYSGFNGDLAVRMYF